MGNWRTTQQNYADWDVRKTIASVCGGHPSSSKLPDQWLGQRQAFYVLEASVFTISKSYLQFSQFNNQTSLPSPLSFEAHDREEKWYDDFSEIDQATRERPFGCRQSHSNAFENFWEIFGYALRAYNSSFGGECLLKQLYSFLLHLGFFQVFLKNGFVSQEI